MPYHSGVQNILIVEDESSIAENLKYALETEHFKCLHVETGILAVETAKAMRFDLIVLDIGLPDISGFDVCKEVRSCQDTPILFLSARDSEIDRILGLEFGADDYVAKPFSPRELTARIRAILRRAHPHKRPKPELNEVCSGLHHDPHSMNVLFDGKPIDLTAHEYKLLCCFLANPNRTFTREQLLENAWDDPGSAMDRTIDAHIKSLRAKLRETSPELAEVIVTRRGLGYLYQPRC